MLKIILIIVIIMIYLGIGIGISLFINCDTDYYESINEFALGVLFWPIISIGLVVYSIIKVVFERNKK